MYPGDVKNLVSTCIAFTSLIHRSTTTYFLMSNHGVELMPGTPGTFSINYLLMLNDDIMKIILGILLVEEPF